MKMFLFNLNILLQTRRLLVQPGNLVRRIRGWREKERGRGERGRGRGREEMIRMVVKFKRKGRCLPFTIA
jgi:hypothetical protein